jgi:hypothetical protein
LKRSLCAARYARLVVLITVVDQSRGAILLGEMGGFGGEKLGCEIASRSFIGSTTLAGLTVLKLGMGWEKALMVGRTTEGFFATGL